MSDCMGWRCRKTAKLKAENLRLTKALEEAEEPPSSWIEVTPERRTGVWEVVIACGPGRLESFPAYRDEEGWHVVGEDGALPVQVSHYMPMPKPVAL